MADKLIFILPGITLLLFIANIFFKGNNVQSCILFVLAFLPLMDLKVTKEAWGGFKTFDVIGFYCLVFLLKEFIMVNLNTHNNFYFFLFLVIIIILLIGGLASEFPARTYVNVIRMLPIFIFGRFLLTEFYKDDKFYIKAINALKISYIVALLVLFIQVVVGLRFTFYPALSPNTIDPVFHTMRYPGVFFDSQASGQFLAMGSFLFLFLETNASKKMTLLNYFAFALFIAGIILAGSRAALAGFAVGLFLVILVGSGPYRIYGAVLIVICAISYFVILPKSGVFERASRINDDYAYRASIWREALLIAKKHPMLGIGWSNYQNYIMRHNQDQYLEMENQELLYFTQPENGYLKVLVELGYIGFAAFALYLVVPIVKGLAFFFGNIYDRRVVLLVAALISWMIPFYGVYSIADYRLLIVITCIITLIISYPQKSYDESASI